MSSEQITDLIGTSQPRHESLEKVNGTAMYIDDLKFDNCLYGATIRSKKPRGKVTGIKFKDGIPWDEFTIVLPKDIKGDNHVLLIEATQPFLAEYVKHIAEPVALIAHRDKVLLTKAVNFVEVEMDEEPAIFDIEESLEKKNIQYGEDNVFKAYSINSGDVDSAWDECDLVLEDVYRTPAQEQFYIETNGVICTVVDGERAEIWGSLQCPYYIQKAMAPLLGLDHDKIRVIQAETGGGFGGKEEYPNLLAGHACLLSVQSGGKPVKMIYDRQEDLWATTKRHPARINLKVGFKKDGTLIAIDMDFVLNGGAYPTLSQTVLSRGILHSFGPYVCPNARINGSVVMTNSNPYGAFRGFGAPQSVFAIELALDRVATKLGIDPAELRRKNFLKKGDKMPTGQIIKEDIDLDRLMDRALEKSDYHNKRKAYEEENKTNNSVKKGISLCVFFHGSGFTGSGEVMMGARAGARITKEGHIEVLSANIEMGQGTNTCFSQIAAETCRLPLSWIHIAQADTDVVPNSGPTVASRTTMVVGKLVQRAVSQVRDKIIEYGSLRESYAPEEFRSAAQRYFKKNGELREEAPYEAPHDIHWDDEKYQGEAYAAFAWSTMVADVTVDMTTYQVEVDNFTSIVEAGKIINPVIAEGQIEGGVAQAIGYAIYEDVVMEQGEMKNTTFTNYVIPTTADIGTNTAEFIEFPFSNPGPFKAKGIGELPADGPAPPIAAAVAQALGGIYITEIPLLPERVMNAINKTDEESGKGVTA